MLSTNNGHLKMKNSSNSGYVKSGNLTISFKYKYHMLIRILSEVKDNRRKQGRRYELVPVIFSAIAAVLSGADSYRKTHSFIKNHYELLNVHFSLNWKNTPS